MVFMDSGAVSLFVKALMDRVEELWLRYKPHRQPGMDKVCRHLNLLCIEMGLSLRVYWDPEGCGYDYDYLWPDVVDEIPMFNLLFKRFALEYDSLLEPMM